MTDSLLRSLRDRAIDEDESLAGLLRKCLLLGAETGSSSLRDWARLELNGYADAETVPDYRKIDGVPMMMDSVSGNTWATGQIVASLQLPVAAREYATQIIFLTQPVEELQRLSQEKSLHFKPPALTAAQAIWNGELGPYESIVSLAYTVDGSVFAGILGQIRTKLVDLIADLTVTTPLTELPRREDIDAAMLHRIGHVGDVYKTTVVHPSGPTAIGAGATASAGLSVDDAIVLLQAVQTAADAADPDTSELDQALTSLRAVLSQPEPQTGEVVKRVGKLREVADKLGVAAISSATGAVISALTELAMSGAFG